MTEWRPIETAPQGKILLFYFEDLNLASVGYYDPDFLAWVSIDTDEPYETTPTHWMLLPESPKDGLTKP